MRLWFLHPRIAFPLATILLGNTLVGQSDTPITTDVKEVDYHEAFLFVRRQLDHICARAGRGYPYYTVGGKWKFSGPSEWTAGYFPGMLWMVYEQTKDPLWLERARRWTDPIAAFRHDDRDLNFGLLFMPTFAEGHRLVGDRSYRRIALDAAGALAKRYMPEGKYLRSWGRVGDPREERIIIIDCLIDLNLLFWGAREARNPLFYEMAHNHSLVTRKAAVRDDGSSIQVIELDPRTGQKLSDRHKQGYSVDSCWSRGQAFGIYALTEVYQYTEDQRFLESARKMADYYVENVPDDYVPYWDFQAPNIPDEVKDTSAAALAAAGMWELAKTVTDSADENRYREVAIKTLDSLTRDYTARGQARSDGRILVHATLHKPAGIAVDESLILGDYYYLELLLKVMKERAPSKK
jgi:unsaturated chondroitin disaccharide hydrolase